MLTRLQEEFRNRFHVAPEQIFFCPGRVNLIGEHIDYNGGKVMPCAIAEGTWLAVSRNIEKRFRFQCLNFPEIAELQVQTSYSKTGKEWFNYPLGVIDAIFQEGHSLSGLNMLFYGNLPVGAGLSSSASIEVVTAFALNQLFALGITRQAAAVLSKKAENEFIGVNCGIMDQFAVAMGKKENAILLDCDTLEHEYIPFATGDYALVIINSNKPRNLAESKYNERFAECGAVLKALKKNLRVENLCQVDRESFEENRHLVNDERLERRALHVITEYERVKSAAIALRAGDLSTFGRLMYASHQSLKEWYEVSGRELDTIVEFCKTFNGCAGARMTGAGFGGCAIALVLKTEFESFQSALETFYAREIGYAPGIHFSGASDGVREIRS